MTIINKNGREDVIVGFDKPQLEKILIDTDKSANDNEPTEDEETSTEEEA